MNLQRLTRVDEFQWRIEPEGPMRVPAILYGDARLLEAMDDKVFEQLRNVTMLPGIVRAAYAMPDAHWGYGFPIGGVAAFDADDGGVVSAGGVGFDISCGVRMLLTGLRRSDLAGLETRLADALYASIPAGLGSTGRIRLDHDAMDDMLLRGARWAVAAGYGTREDLAHIEEQGCISGALPEAVSDKARSRQKAEMGTLGSGNHYLEVQRVSEAFDTAVARAFGLARDDIVISIHCGSRGLGHQIGTEYLREMAIAAAQSGLHVPDRELACAPIRSDVGQRYLGAMRAAMNCALANRQVLTHLAREAFADLLPRADLQPLFDVSHNICKEEEHEIDGVCKHVFVHRKGATRAFGPGSAQLPEAFRATGQPVFVGGSMGTASYVLAGAASGEERSLSSSCHGAGRAMSRNAARKRWQGLQLVNELEARGIHIRSPSLRGVAEEAPGAYKDVEEVVDLAEKAGLSTKVARLEPIICIKG
jgi:tRNA-splicing ligase RtcB